MEPQQVVIGKKQSRPPTTETQPDEIVNLATLFSQEERAKMGNRVWDLYVDDVRSRAPRMKKLQSFVELYASLQKTKSFPFHNAANINLPLLTYPILQVQARLYDMVWPENGKIIYSAPSSPSDVARADATEKFGNHYLRTEMPEMEQGMDDSIGQMGLFGSAFRRTYFDPHEFRVRSDWIPIEDFVVAHHHRSQDPSMRDVPRYTLVHHMTLADLESYGNSGVFEFVDGITPADSSPEGEMFRDVKDRLDGLSSGAGMTDDPDKPRMVLEQHCRWRMPNSPSKHPAFDGQYHYVIITIDEPTKRVLRVVLREEDDPADLKRALREQAKAAALMPPPIPGPDGMLPPVTLPPLRKVRKRQVCFFTHYRAFPSEGFYGLGFGDFLAPLAKSANTLLNQHIDGVTIRNARPGFISRQLRGPRGAINVQPGVLQEVDAPPAVVREGIVWLDPPQNDPTTLPLINMNIGMAEKISGSADLMSGSTSGSNRTAKEIQILNSQLMKQISILGRRVKAAFKHELDKIWRCWGMFLPEEPEDMPIVDPSTGQPETLPISRALFLPDARVTPAADPRMRFEKIEEAQQKFGTVMQNPLTAQNPMVLYEVTADVLRSLGAERILAFVQKPQPPPPPQPKPHIDEEAGWLRGENPPVHPDDNDDEHQRMHLTFLSSPQAQMMTKQQRDAAEQHVRNHAAQGLMKRYAAAQANQSMGGMGMAMGAPQMGPPQMGGMNFGA